MNKDQLSRLYSSLAGYKKQLEDMAFNIDFMSQDIGYLMTEVVELQAKDDEAKAEEFDYGDNSDDFDFYDVFDDNVLPEHQGTNR